LRGARLQRRSLEDVRRQVFQSHSTGRKGFQGVTHWPVARRETVPGCDYYKNVTVLLQKKKVRLLDQEL
jgi:hypothetical protein